MNFDIKNCKLCPRRCGADRTLSCGVCHSGAEMRVARAALHFWEEPVISGRKGSGAIFFSGCSLGCVYCQNSEISQCDGAGESVSAERLREICFELKDSGAHNINLVTPTHLAPIIREALMPIKKELAIPIVCNTGGYESKETLGFFDGLVDIYLPDFKYALPECAARLSRAADYPIVALTALKEMLRQVGKPYIGNDGMMKSGVIVRHLVIPGERKNSLEVIKTLGENFESDDFLISLMSQYTPQEGIEGAPQRRLTTFEYESVRSLAEKYSFEGFSQDFASASSSYTPPFDLSGVKKSEFQQ